MIRGMRLNRSRAMKFAAAEVAASCEVKQRLGEKELRQIVACAEASVRALAASRRLYLFGNGGSAADAQHIAAELVGRFRRKRAALPAVSLTTDTSILTAVGNDYSFEDIFVRQVEALAQQGDVVVGITTSGRSENVVRALRRAQQLGCATLAFCGAYTRRLSPVTNTLVAVPSTDTQRIQEVHALIGHIYCELIEQTLFPRG